MSYKLRGKIEELEIENKRIKQVANFRNRRIEVLERRLEQATKSNEYWHEQFNSLNKDSKAELTYWKETAENWKDLYKEADSGLQYFKARSSKLEKVLTNSIKKC